MAEGHAVARWVRELEPLVGSELVRVEVPSTQEAAAEGLGEERLRAVESRGKHLLLHFTDGRVVHCHAMMYGSWQVGPADQEPRKEARHVRLRLRTPEREALFFHGPVVEVLHREELHEHRWLGNLGPDLLAEDFDREEAARRVADAGDTAVGAVLLRQSVVAGIGNIFKSEGLFEAGVDPRRPARALERAELERIWDVTRPMMRRNVEREGPIVTLPDELRGDEGQRHWVYRRRGNPCRRCGEEIRMVRQGEHDRTTYFCPACQT